MSVTDNAIYVNGKRAVEPPSLEETFEVMKEHNGVAWIDLYQPDKAELMAVVDELSLHHLAVTDALTGHQRAKLERYEETLFLVLRPARYLDDVEKVEFGEVHLFIGLDFVVSVRQSKFPDLEYVRKRLESQTELIAQGPLGIVYGIVDLIVDEYAPVLVGLENDIDEIEDELFSGKREVSRRVYELLREVIEFQRATVPLEEILNQLLDEHEGARDVDELQRHLRDVLDHVLRISERSEAFRALLQNALLVHSTLVAQKQNDEMQKLTETSLRQGEEVKKISSWAAVLFAPTLVASLYGMNFSFMPELRWEFGYPYALAVMVAIGCGLYWAFKRRGWL